MKKIKVLIVDDSAFMRKLLSEFFEGHSRIEVAGKARNGMDALQKTKELKPDVITMDIEMPVMNGLESLKRIMAECPAAVIMLSSTTQQGTDNTLTAMQFGAFDFIAKPSGAISLDLHKIKEELIEKVLCAGAANVTKLHTPPVKTVTTPDNADEHNEIETSMKVEKLDNRKQRHDKKLVLIGTSTGGPRALQSVLSKLPASLDAPVLIVQHMPAGFTRSLAGRLDSLSAIRVKEAEDGEILHKGTAYIAPGGWHLKVKKVGMSLAASLDQMEPVNGHRPSVDVLFESASQLSDYLKIAVIMTGMGSDGARGLTMLDHCGDMHGIAESEETSIVFGMPKAAIATGCIEQVAEVEKIAKAIVSYC